MTHITGVLLRSSSSIGSTYLGEGGGLDLLLMFRESNVVYEVGSLAPRGGTVG